MAEAFKARFDAALEELNFGQRCHKLAQLGKDIKAAQPANVQAILDSFMPESKTTGPVEAFAEKARLIVAKTAGCAGYAKKLLDSPSKTVGFSAATEGLLNLEDARAAFLSSDTSRKMKKFLLKCDALKSDKEVLEHAFELFGAKDKEMFWPLLARAESEDLLMEYLEDDKPMHDWLSGKTQDKVPGLPQLAQRFPAFMVKMVTSGVLKWRWYWVKEILEKDPMMVLRAVIVDGHEQGSGPKTGYAPKSKNQGFYSTLAHWGWRRQPDMMLKIVAELTAPGGSRAPTGTFRSKGRGKGMVFMQGRTSQSDLGLPGYEQVQRLATELMNVTSTRNALTKNKKIAMLMKIWDTLPATHKVAKVAHMFGDLLPSFSTDEHRKSEIANLIAAFWKMLQDVGRSDRQHLLVGPLVASGPQGEKRPTGCTDFFKLFMRRLPSPLAVEQLFKILDEFEAGTPAYKFVQSDICKSSNGRHDDLMQSVFKKYLLKEDEGPVKAAEMFQVLLKDARSRDIIQTSYDILLEHLEDHSELGLLQSVVQRMGGLERQARTKGTREITPEATLPVPTEWLKLVELKETALPHTKFLLLVLHTGIGEADLLGSMTVKYGKIFFWDSLDHILSAAQGKLIEKATPKPDLLVLKDVNVQVIEDAEKKLPGKSGRKSSKGSTGVGSVIFGTDGSKWGTVVADDGRVWKLDSGRIAKKETEGDKWTWAGGATTKGEEGACKYFASVADMKKKANVKDPSARLAGYSDLLTLAGKERDAGKAFDDLLPFLLSRFNAEQEQGRSHILNEVLVNKKFPDDLWEERLEHLRSFWKVSSKARENASYQCSWNKCGRHLVQKALENWGKPVKEGEAAPEYPTEACLFGLEVTADINLPELLVKSHSKIETLKDLEAATRWVLETAVPLQGESTSPLQDFWEALKTMSTIKFCGEDPDAITSWNVSPNKNHLKVHKEKSSSSAELGTKEAGTVVRGIQRGNWLELVDSQGFMLIISEKTGLPVMQQDSGNTGEKGLWETYPFIGEWWKKLLAQGVKQKGIDFVFVGILNLLAERQHRFITGDRKLSKRWWAPLDCSEYKDAVSNILKSIESGIIPAKEGSEMICRRIAALKDISVMTDKEWKVLGTARRERWEDKTERLKSVGRPLGELSFRRLPGSEWVSSASWDIQKNKVYKPLPWQTYRCKDTIAAAELAALSKLLDAPNRRQVLWMVVAIGAMLSGPQITKLLEASIATLNARFEGMARTVGRHYPYFNSALTKNETLDGSSDVLTPLMELLLLDDSTRDGLVEKLMQRDDCELFVFFGTSFSRHLCNCRQEWLHKCIDKLKAPGASTEFYHFRKRGLLLSQIARYGKADPGWRDVIASNQKKGAVQTYLWHPKTQTEFLEKALWSTEPEELTLIPRLEFADGVSKVSQLLSIYPKEQTTKDTGSDAWGWEVIQAAGAYSDLNTEVERRFAELPDPSFCDKVDDPEVETLLTALGRSDNAAAAMQVLGPHAGKVKQAKEAVTKMIAQLSPPQARVLIRQVMLPKKAGVGLQVAGLKKIVDLRIPDPLELYTFVWRKGECQRDVAGNILSKVATSGEFRPEDVRFYFDYFDRTDNQDDQAYVAQIMLDQLIEQPEWVLPYLPKVVSKLAMVPGATNKSVQALKSCTSNVTDVVEALTHVVQASRLASRTDPKHNKEGTDGRVLADLISMISFGQFTELVNAVARMSLEDCDSATLKTFLKEVFHRWEEAVAGKDSNANGYFSCALSAWVKLLRSGEYNTWVTELADVEKRTAEKGNVDSWRQLAQAVAGHAPDIGLSPDEWDQMLQVLRSFFVRVLEGPLRVNREAAEKKIPTDDTFKKDNEARDKVRNDLIETHWTGLLSHGCTEDESNELFKRCPESLKMSVASNLVEAWHKRHTEDATRESKAAAFQQERPDGGWKHTGGKPISSVTVGSIVSGNVTNSSKEFGVYVNFGCEKDGRLSVPQADWKKYRVGDRVERMVVHKVKVERKFVDLLVVGSKGQSIGLAASKQVAERALKWIASSPELRSTFCTTIQKLWAKIVTADSADKWEASLQLLVEAPTAKQSVDLVNRVIEQKPTTDLMRVALNWLSRISAADAVRLWPKLLHNDGQTWVNTDDVTALLKLCETNGLELPKFSQVICKAMREPATEALSKSQLPEARLAAIHILREQHNQKSGAPPAGINALCYDPVHVVRAAARDQWVALGGKDEGWKKKKTDEEKEGEEEDDE
ncbi:unnamed protein product [Symbiodinium natans]|uniref:S1 motif domain-containing protein n=1 Tax=Symbiodinium natans TaxID=878477 RepID=A0A812SRT3_9DINO|nr:unnamed protein product [Symbiodinium natans]